MKKVFALTLMVCAAMAVSFAGCDNTKPADKAKPVTPSTTSDKGTATTPGTTEPADPAGSGTK